jgi:hypothetical protein
MRTAGSDGSSKTWPALRAEWVLAGRLRPSRGSAQPNQFANPALSGMDDPNPFLPVILTSTTLLLAAMAVAVTLI